jgi:ornithine carbamoyltransferase
MGVTYLDTKTSQIGNKESIADTARVLSSMYDGIEYRGYGQEIVEELAKYSSVPVWNGLTNEFHPTQILADFLTIRERFGHLRGINLVYVGDARYNMGNSLMVGCAKMGLNFTICCPEKYFPDHALIDKCKEIAKENGASLSFESNIDKALSGADVVYTDVWVSMGEPMEIWEERINDLSDYQVNAALMKKTGKDTSVFMHCLPAYHDLKTKIGKDICDKFGRTEIEVTDEVFESECSLVFLEAENRMHTIKAVMAATLL